MKVVVYENNNEEIKCAIVPENEVMLWAEFLNYEVIAEHDIPPNVEIVESKGDHVRCFIEANDNRSKFTFCTNAEYTGFLKDSMADIREAIDLVPCNVLSVERLNAVKSKQ